MVKLKARPHLPQAFISTYADLLYSSTNIFWTNKLHFWADCRTKKHICNIYFTCPDYEASHLPVTAPPLLFPVCRDWKQNREHHWVNVKLITCAFSENKQFNRAENWEKTVIVIYAGRPQVATWRVTNKSINKMIITDTSPVFCNSL